ncbi:DUF935 domain-containing protein [Martelella limonii]|uniref:DUF935 domain-containing protein n=1 Tax=Martelella limonii TaxID=1647649 RepID=UPI0015812EA4|nr:DUF935 family protein [Martelella limonii]
MAKPERFEIATAASDPFIPSFQGVLQPMDEVLAARGGASALKLYDEIRRDPHAHAVLAKLKLEVVSREWAVFPASETSKDKEIADAVEAQLKAINFDRLTRGLLGAILKGFAVAEIIWIKENSLWKAEAVKVKKQRRFRFTVEGELRMLTRSSTMDGEPVPDGKFIVHRHSIDDDDDDPYGVGIGSVLFWPAWFKRQVLAHWLRGTEKHATPTTLAQYSGGFDQAKQDQLLNALRRMAGDTGLAVPDTVNVSLLEAKSAGGGDVFEALSRYLDELMSEAVLGETLSTNSGERGARSLGEIHNEVRIAIAKAAADLVCETVRDTLVRWFVEFNWPGAAIPEVWRDFSEAEDLNEKVERDKKIYEMGYEPEDEEYFNETYGGAWVKRKAPEPAVTSPGKQLPKAEEGTDFAEHSHPPDAASEIADQMEALGDPVIAAMIAEIRNQANAATDFDDLSLRLARLSAEMDIDGFAELMEQGMTLARLEGHDSVGSDG